jgi:peptide chain release factor 2
MQRCANVRDVLNALMCVWKAEWGQQIRNYVLHPYKLVKDVRTGVETADTEAVLDGELKPFIVAYLRHRATAAGDGEPAVLDS